MCTTQALMKILMAIIIFDRQTLEDINLNQCKYLKTVSFTSKNFFIPENIIQVVIFGLIKSPTKVVTRLFVTEKKDAVLMEHS